MFVISVLLLGCEIKKVKTVELDEKYKLMFLNYEHV